jgi:hypothetical protein
MDQPELWEGDPSVAYRHEGSGTIRPRNGWDMEPEGNAASANPTRYLDTLP